MKRLGLILLTCVCGILGIIFLCIELRGQAPDVNDANEIIILAPILDHNEHGKSGSWTVSSDIMGGSIEIICNEGTLEASGDMNVLINVLYDYLMKFPPNTHTKPVVFLKERSLDPNSVRSRGRPE